MKPFLQQDNQISFGTFKNHHNSQCSVILCVLRNGSISPSTDPSLSHWRVSLNLSLSPLFTSHPLWFLFIRGVYCHWASVYHPVLDFFPCWCRLIFCSLHSNSLSMGPHWPAPSSTERLCWAEFLCQVTLRLLVSGICVSDVYSWLSCLLREWWESHG